MQKKKKSFLNRENRTKRFRVLADQSSLKTADFHAILAEKGHIVHFRFLTSLNLVKKCFKGANSFKMQCLHVIF